MRRQLPAPAASAALWLGVILISALALRGTRPPAALGLSAPPSAFSAARAATHLDHVAKQTHPIGSDEAVRVREYLVGELRAVGGEVRVEQAIGTARYGRTLHSAVVNNIVATFPGSSNSRAMMLAA